MSDIQALNNRDKHIADDVVYDNEASGLSANNVQGAMDEVNIKVDTHNSNTSNPHSITKSQIGLGNVDNTSDLNKPISTATRTALNGKANSSHGYHVPTPQKASNKVFLRNDNTWQTITPANIGASATSHTHSYLPLSGGTLTGALTANAGIYLPNGKYIYAKSTGGTNCSILGISGSNNVFLGYSTGSGTEALNLYSGQVIDFNCQCGDSYVGTTMRLYREQTDNHRTILRSNTNGSIYLGSSGYRWNTAFFTNAITASDLKEKDIIEDFDFKAKDFIMSLEPIAYRRTGTEDGGERIHLGLGAQTLAKHINNLNIGNLSMVQACIINDDGEESPYYGEEIDDSKLSWGINYTELIPQLIKMVQEQQKEIDVLQNELIELKSQINS